MVQKRSKAGLNTGCTLRLLRDKQIFPRICAEQHVLGKHKNFTGDDEDGLDIEDGDMECLGTQDLFYSMNKRRRWLVSEHVRQYMFGPKTYDRVRVIMLTREAPLQYSTDLLLGVTDADCLSFCDSVLETMVQAPGAAKPYELINAALKPVKEFTPVDDRDYAEGERKIYDTRSERIRGVQRKVPPPVGGYSHAKRGPVREKREVMKQRQYEYEACQTVKYEVFSPQQISARHFMIRARSESQFQEYSTKLDKHGATSKRLLDEAESSGMTRVRTAPAFGRRPRGSRVSTRPVRVSDFNQGKLQGGPSWKRSRIRHMRLGFYLQQLVERELEKRRTKSSPVSKEALKNATEEPAVPERIAMSVAQQTGESHTAAEQADAEETPAETHGGARTKTLKPKKETRDASTQFNSETDAQVQPLVSATRVEVTAEEDPKPVAVVSKPVITYTFKEPIPESQVRHKEAKVLSDSSLDALAEEVGDCMVLSMYLNIPTTRLVYFTIEKAEKRQTVTEMSVNCLQYWKTMRRTASENDKVSEIGRALGCVGRRDVAEVVRECHKRGEELTKESLASARDS